MNSATSGRGANEENDDGAGAGHSDTALAVARNASAALSGSPTARVTRGALTLLLTQPITWITSLLGIILWPRYLGAEGMGQIAMAGIVSGFASLVVGLGVPEYLGRRVATHPHLVQQEGGAALFLVTVISSVAAVVIGWAGPLLHIPIETLLLRISLAGMVVGTQHSILYALLRGQERYTAYALLNVAITSILGLAGGATLLLGGTIHQLVLVTVITDFTIFVTFWHLMGFRFRRSAVNPRTVLDLTRCGLPFLGWRTALSSRGWVEGGILAALSNTATVGWYGVASRVVAIPIFIPTLVTTPLLPALSRCAGDRHTFATTVRTNLIGILLLMTPLCAGIIACATVVPDILGWPQEFRNATIPMAILSLSMPLIALDMVLGTALLALHRERAWMGVAAISSVFSPLMLLWTVPLFGRVAGNAAIGAAGVVVATEIVMLIGALVLLPRRTVDLPTTSRLVRIVLAGVALIVVTKLLLPLWLPLAIVAGGLTYVGGALLLRAVTLSEAVLLLRMVFESFPARLRRTAQPANEAAAAPPSKSAGGRQPSAGRAAAERTDGLVPDPVLLEP